MPPGWFPSCMRGDSYKLLELEPSTHHLFLRQAVFGWPRHAASGWPISGLRELPKAGRHHPLRTWENCGSYCGCWCQNGPAPTSQVGLGKLGLWYLCSQGWTMVKGMWMAFSSCVELPGAPCCLLASFPRSFQSFPSLELSPSATPFTPSAHLWFSEWCYSFILGKQFSSARLRTMFSDGHLV